MGSVEQVAVSEPLAPYSHTINGRIVAGIVYILLPTAILALYTPFNIMLLVDRKFNSLEVHRLMFALGILDSIQLLTCVYAGFATIWPDILDQVFIVQVVGGIKSSAWSGVFPLTLLMAVCRFIIIRGSAHPCEKCKLGIKIALFISAVYTMGVCICGMGFVRISYSPSRLIWRAERSLIAYIMSQVDFGVSSSCMILSFLFYVAIAISVYKMNSGTRKIGRNEMRLLIHASLLFSALALIILLYRYSSLIVPSTEWTYFALTNFLILYSGLNPVLYIIFSKYVVSEGIFN